MERWKITRWRIWRLVGLTAVSKKANSENEGISYQFIENMRREGYLIEEIVQRPNLECAFQFVLKGRKRKESNTGRHLLEHHAEVIDRMEREISLGTWELSGLHHGQVVENGKVRDIDYATLYDRMVLHAIMSVVEEHLKRRWIYTSASGIEGKGGVFLLRKLISDMNKNGHTKVFKWDIYHYYQSIRQDFMLWVIERNFKDKRLIALLKKCVYAMPEGISIGLRSSQTFGNLLLDNLVDHYLKDKLGAENYYRYCDDGVNIAKCYEELSRYKDAIDARLRSAGLTMKGNYQFWDIADRPVDFLGYIIYDDGNIRIRKHIKQRFARRYKRVRSKRRRKELIGSFYGMAKHARAKHLFKSITGITMKDFKDFGLVFEAADGKKRWDCPTIPLGDLQNTTIIVEDFERDIQVRGNELRHLVKFKYENGEDGKFFTASEELKQMLEKIDTMDGGFPFKTTIKRTTIGNGKFKYSFT